MTTGLINAFRHLEVAFTNAGLRKPVAVVLASQEEMDQLSYLTTMDAPRGYGESKIVTTQINGIEIRVKGGDQVNA